jgi:membrane peptidoglycan carboxypeptidase
MALANDRLAPAAQVLSAVGGENVRQVAREFGLLAAGSTGGDSGLLEGSEATLLQVAHAYGVFANQGVLAGAGQPQGTSSEPLQPVTILRIEDSTGQVVWPNPASQRRSITSSQLAYLITDVLSDETARWPSLGHPNLLEIGRPAAAKLGRVNSGKDAWTVGYTPQLVAGAWVGYAKEMSGEPSQPLSPETAGALWRALVLYASRTAEPSGWTPPAGITTLDVCDRSGLLPTSDCPEVVQEVFLTGSEPEPDTLFKRT